MASKKFDKLVEHVVNGDEKSARALFHNIVVGMSRKIYEDFDLDEPDYNYEQGFAFDKTYELGSGDRVRVIIYDPARGDCKVKFKLSYQSNGEDESIPPSVKTFKDIRSAYRYGKLTYGISIPKKIRESDESERAFDEVNSDHSGDVDPDEDEVIGGDETDDFEDEVKDDSFDIDGDNEGLHGGDELNPPEEERVTDLEDELDSLKSEFEQLRAETAELAGSDAEGDAEEAEDLDTASDDDEEVEDYLESEEGDDEDFDFSEHEASEDDDDDDTENDEDDDTEEVHEDDESVELPSDDEEPVSENLIREYVEKVTRGLSTSAEADFVGKKSPVAGKNEIVKGVGPKNIAQNATEKGRPAPTPKEMFSGEIQNRPGGKAKLKPAAKAKTKPEKSNKGPIEGAVK